MATADRHDNPEHGQSKQGQTTPQAHGGQAEGQHRQQGQGTHAPQNQQAQQAQQGQQGSQGQQGAQGQGQQGQRGSRREGRGEPASLMQQREQITSDAQALMADMRDAAGAIEDYLGQQLRDRPYATLAVAGAAGYLIGGGLATRFNRMVFGLTGRILVGIAARELAMRLDVIRDGNLPEGEQIH